MSRDFGYFVHMDTLHGISRLGALLRTGDIVKLLGAGCLIGIVRWTEVLAIGVYTYQQTGSPFMVA